VRGLISKKYILPILHNPNNHEHESQLQPHKIHRRYGVLRRADVYRVPRDRLFLLRKDIGGGRQRFHRRKCRLGHSVADGWDGGGEGGVMIYAPNNPVITEKNKTVLHILHLSHENAKIKYLYNI